ncbi:hypothetical protein Peur_030621 [Populus x canadensis]
MRMGVECANVQRLAIQSGFGKDGMKEKINGSLNCQEMMRREGATLSVLGVKYASLLRQNNTIQFWEGGGEGMDKQKQRTQNRQEKISWKGSTGEKFRIQLPVI